MLVFVVVLSAVTCRNPIHLCKFICFFMIFSNKPVTEKRQLILGEDLNLRRDVVSPRNLIPDWFCGDTTLSVELTFADMVHIKLVRLTEYDNGNLNCADIAICSTIQTKQNITTQIEWKKLKATMVVCILYVTILFFFFSLFYLLL